MRAQKTTQPLTDAVVVITGASSGIGRATAREFAHRGAAVALAARQESILNEVAEECRGLGARTLVVPTDTSDDSAVEALAQRTMEQFGHLDVWVNGAAVYAAGRFEDVPADVFRRVIETDLLGYAAGARSALRQFRRGTNIHACALLPASIDTPIFQHAANYSGRALRAMSPVTSPEKVARAVVKLAEHPRRQALVGASAGFLTRLSVFLPGLADRMVARMIEFQHFRAAPAAPTPGNLFAPSPEWSDTSGGWKRHGLPLARRTPAAAQARG
jgi:NAD(P)-dependent dehydrogenase (short-subunit alcohol dehydrogenase family)